MKIKHLLKIVLSICILSTIVSIVKAQPIVKVYLPGHAAFDTSPFYPMLGPGKKNTLGLMSYTTEKTDTTLEAVVNKRFKTIKLEFYNKSLSGKPPELYTTLILTDVDVTTVDLPDVAKKQVRPDGYFYGHPYMFKFKSMQEKKPGYKGNIF